ncbi:hypothetical protein [Deinococcus marmoris]|uniref:hypothetical protein n=1 Tax=Deinococcus marmoris TaxID=249408 RepID=UPI0012DBFB35|nr:hypothetical protein [Deinococcus marmoris]
MTNFSQFLPETIYIIDDNQDTAGDIKDQVEDLGCKPILITRGHFSTTSELMEEIEPQNAGIICDHRLQHGSLADFFGSEFVALSYSQRLPALLLTEYGEQDVDTTIRRYRRNIPILLQRSNVDLKLIADGMIKCIEELKGNIETDRRPHRTFVKVTHIDREGEDIVADVFIDSWKPKTAIRLPISLMGDDVADYVTSKLVRNADPPLSVRLLAKVNLGASNSWELYFDEFEIPGEPRSSLESLVTKKLYGKDIE